MLKNKNIIYAIIIFLIAMFTLLLICFDKIIYKPVTDFNISKIIYSSVYPPDKELSTPKEFVIQSSQKRDLVTKFHISFDFMSNDYNVFDNLFQTDNDNNGLRAEYYRNGNLVLMWRNSDNPADVKMEDLGILKDNEIYTLTIDFVTNRYFKAMKYTLVDNDNNIVKKSIEFGRKDYFYPLVNRVIIGANNDRIFNGSITNAEIKFSQQKLSVPLVIIFFAVELFLLIGIILLLGFIIKNQLKKSPPLKNRRFWSICF